MDLVIKLMSMETGHGREYMWCPDEKLLWVTDYDAAVRPTAKRWFPMSWNPIEHIRQQALGGSDLSLEDLDDPLT